MERNTETLGHVLQIGMIAYNKRYLHIPLTSGVTRQQVEQAMGHLWNKDSHTRFCIGEIETEIHLIFLCIQSGKIILNLFLRHQKIFQFPFNTHKKDILYMVYILIQIDNITFIHRYKVCFLSFFKLQHSRFEFAKITIYCKTTNFSSKKFKTSSEMFRFLQERFSYQE